MQTRVYTAPGANPEALVDKVRSWFVENQYETQFFKLPNGSLLVQGYRDDIWRVAVGLAAALTVSIRPLPEDQVEVSIGAGAWADKLVVAGIGLLLFLPLVLPAAWGTWKQYQLDRELWQVVEAALPAGAISTPGAAAPAVEAAPLPDTWFNEQTNEVYSVQFFQRMESWQRAIADGRIEPEEIQAQGERVTALLRRLDTTVSDAAHARLTLAFSELAVLQGMQSFAMLQHLGGKSGPAAQPVDQ